MNLRDLHYLIAVADHLHFGRAAAACHVSQPTLSMQLKKLEDTLGVQLFERTNKEVRLTEPGCEVVARARRVLDEVAQMKQAALAARDPESGTLRLGIFPTLAPYLLPQLMPKLVVRFPKLTLQLIEEKTPVLIERLKAGALDAALLAMPVESTHLESRELFREPFLLASAGDHPIAKRKYATLEDLPDLHMLLLEDGHCLRDQALEVCHLAGTAEAGSFRATSLETLRHMVAASDAVTLMPRLAAQGGGLAYLPFRGVSPHRTIGLYWRRSSARIALFEAIADVVSNAYKELSKNT